MRLRGIPGMATHDLDDWILRGGARDRPAHVFVKIWREIGGKSWQASTSINKCACDGGQLQALRPCGGDYSSMLRLTEVHTSLISQNVHVLNGMAMDS